MMGSTFKRRAKEFFNSFREFDSDEDAVLAGWKFGQLYRTSDAHMGGVGGILKQVRIPT